MSSEAVHNSHLIPTAGLEMSLSQCQVSSRLPPPNPQASGTKDRSHQRCFPPEIQIKLDLRKALLVAPRPI